MAASIDLRAGRVWSLAALALAGAQGACSEIVGIDDRSGSWCSIEAGDHDFCEDFDRAEPFAGWAATGAARVGSSDRSLPNAFIAQTGAALERDFPEAKGGELLLELDLRMTATAPRPDDPPVAYDHAVAMLTRGSGSVGLFVGPAGLVFFGSPNAGPSAVPEASLGTSSRRFAISYKALPDKDTALLVVDDAFVFSIDIQPPSEPDLDATARVLVGAAPLLSGTKATIECAIDNVTVDGQGVAP